MEKKRQYEERIQEVEHSSFAPLVMSCTGGMGNIAFAFYKRLAAMISEKKDIPYSQMVYLIHCKVSFALLRSSIMCIRGSRSRCGHSSTEPYENCRRAHLKYIYSDSYYYYYYYSLCCSYESMLLLATVTYLFYYTYI